MYRFCDQAQDGSVQAKFPIAYSGIALSYGTTKLEGTRLSYRSQRNKTKQPEENCVGHLSLVAPSKCLLPAVLGDSALHDQQYFYGRLYSNYCHSNGITKTKVAAKKEMLRKRKQRTAQIT
jgi:hypothetical protein